jgi:hypothetical protein
VWYCTTSVPTALPILSPVDISDGALTCTFISWKDWRETYGPWALRAAWYLAKWLTP